MYYFQASDPLSLPPPVSFSPPKAPPISAPEVLELTFIIPQSEPLGPTHLNTFYISFVNKLEDKPYGTPLLYCIAYSKLSNLNTYRIGIKFSS